MYVSAWKPDNEGSEAAFKKVAKGLGVLLRKSWDLKGVMCFAFIYLYPCHEVLMVVVRPTPSFLISLDMFPIFCAFLRVSVHNFLRTNLQPSARLNFYV